MSWIDDPWMGLTPRRRACARSRSPRHRRAGAHRRRVLHRSGVSAPDQVATWLTDPGVEIPEQAHGRPRHHDRAGARRDGRPIGGPHELAGTIVEHWLRGFTDRRIQCHLRHHAGQPGTRRHRLGSFEERPERYADAVVDPLVLDHVDRFRRAKH